MVIYNSIGFSIYDSDIKNLSVVAGNKHFNVTSPAQNKNTLSWYTPIQRYAIKPAFKIFESQEVLLR